MATAGTGVTAKMQQRSRVPNAVACIVLYGVFGAVAARAGTFDIAGDLGVGNSDNIARTVVGQRSETIASIGTQFLIAEETPHFKADALGDLAYLDYTRNTFQSEIVGSVAAKGSFQIVPGSLAWAAEESFGQAKRDPLAAVTPANQENVNYFSTGPNGVWRIDDATRLELQGRYTRLDYEISPYSSERVGGNLALSHALTDGTKVSLTALDERISPLGSNLVSAYDRQQGYATYSANGARTAIAIDAGVSRDSQSAGSTAGALLRLRLTHKLGTFSTITLAGGRELTDTGTALAPQNGPGLVLPAPGTQNLGQTSAPYVGKTASVDWAASGRRTRLDVAVNWGEDSYPSAPTLDRRRLTYSAVASRELGPRLTARASIYATRYTYSSGVSGTRDRLIDAGLNWHWTQRLSLDVSLERYYFENDTEVPVVNETRAWLRLRYGYGVARRIGG